VEQTGEVEEAQAKIRDRWIIVTVRKGVDGKNWA
jgi:hypothetical protein